MSSTVSENVGQLLRNGDTLTQEQIAAMMAAEIDCSKCVKQCASKTNEVGATLRSKIAKDEPLYGSASAHSWHMILNTGISATKWPQSLEDVDDSYSQHVHQTIQSVKSKIIGGIRVSASETPSVGGVDSEFECDLIIYPLNIYIQHVKREDIPSVLNAYIIDSEPKDIDPIDKNNTIPYYYQNKRKQQQQQQQDKGTQPSSESSASSGNDDDSKSSTSFSLTVTHLPPSPRIQICGHKKRDNRCGMIAPILKEQFIRELIARGIACSNGIDEGEEGQGAQGAQGGQEADGKESSSTCSGSGCDLGTVEVELISHVGGHKYAGNVIIQTNKKGLGSVWYGRVFPEHIAVIVEKTVINKEIVKPLYRGSTFDW